VTLIHKLVAYVPQTVVSKVDSPPVIKIQNFSFQHVNFYNYVQLITYYLLMEVFMWETSCSKSGIRTVR